MGNTAIAYDNLIDSDSVSITATSEIPTATVDLLQDPHVFNRWTTATGGSHSLFVDFGANVELDTVALMGFTGSSDVLYQLRLAITDIIGGDVYNSGALTGVFEEGYLPLVHLVPAPVRTARYMLLSLADSSVSSFGAGRLFAGVRNEFEVPFAPGWQRTAVNRSRREEGDGGQTFIDPRRGYWRINATYSWMTADERDGFVEAYEMMKILNGHQDMLWIRDVDSTNLSRDCLWGYEEEDGPIVEPAVVFPQQFSKSLTIRERL